MVINKIKSINREFDLHSFEFRDGHRLDGSHERAAHDRLQNEACTNREGKLPTISFDEIADERRHDKRADTAARHCDAGRDTALLVKVLRHHDQRGYVRASGRDASDHAVASEHVVDARREYRKHVHAGSDHATTHNYRATSQLIN